MPSLAEVPPVPSVEAEPDPLPEPAAEPPVPTELLDWPSPAEVPPVPSVDAEPEPLPEPAAEPPVPTELLDWPPPAEEPPVPRVEAEPVPQLVVPGAQLVPAELPPVPTVLLDVPPPALVPPVPTVLLVWAKADSVVPARSAAAKAARVTMFISYLLEFPHASDREQRFRSCEENSLSTARVPGLRLQSHPGWDLGPWATPTKVPSEGEEVANAELGPQLRVQGVSKKEVQMEESVYQARWLLIIIALLVVAMTTVGAAAG